jgi:hypothetical protein
MADVLAILRDAYINKRPIVFDKESDEIVIGSFRYPRGTKTSLKAQKGSGDNYPVRWLDVGLREFPCVPTSHQSSFDPKLDAVWFCLQLQDKSNTDYVKEALGQKFSLVGSLRCLFTCGIHH